MVYLLLIKEKPRSFIRGLDVESRRRIGQGLRCLEKDPFHSRSGCDIKKLSGTLGRSDAWRIRIGLWRGIYFVRGSQVELVVFEWRDKAYDF